MRNDCAVLIVNYHNILKAPPNAFFASIRSEWHPDSVFAQQLETLMAHFTIVPLSEIVAAIARGRLYPRLCAITFDDGNLGAYRYGLPLLEKYDLGATFFIITRRVEVEKPETGYFDWLEAQLYLTEARRIDLRSYGYGEFSLADLSQKVAFFKAFRRQIKVIPEPVKMQIDAEIARQLAVPDAALRAYLQQEAYRMMNWQQIADLQARGGEIGGHTRTHPALSQVDQATLEAEICGCYQDLRERLGPGPLPFAYPYGNPQHVSAAAVETARRAGYYCAVTMFKGKNKPGVDPFLLRRTSYERLAKKLGWGTPQSAGVAGQ